MQICILKVELNTVFGNHFTITYLVKEPQPKVKQFSFNKTCTRLNLNNAIHKRLFGNGFVLDDRTLYKVFEEFITMWLLQN